MNLNAVPRVLWMALAASAFAMFLLPLLRQRRVAKLLESLRADWGRMRDRERDMTAIGSYCRHRLAAEGSMRSLDDRTWADLNMDEIFALVDRTESVVGRQVLYRRMRSSPVGDRLEAFEALASAFGEDVQVRERVQVKLAALRESAGYDLWRLTEPGTLRPEAWQALMPVFAVVMLGLVVAAPFWHQAIVLIIAGSFVSFVTRATAARQLTIVSGAFTQIAPLLSAAETIAAVRIDGAAPLVGTLTADCARLARLKQIARWVSRDAGDTIVAQLAGALLEYLNLLFCLDANALFFGARELAVRSADLIRVIEAVGDTDAALSVASFRAGVSGWTRPVFVPPGSPTSMTGVQHPLLPDAVPNSIVIDHARGAIITGSNMSGKTTFLRTIGTAAVLAQTINTCLADTYSSPPFVVRSCIGRADDPASGKSYYLVEVESVLAMVEWSQSAQPHLFLFDEMFRGTNAVERIAGGEAVLRWLVARKPADPPCVHAVLAATHDQELVDLLRGLYAPYHFADTMDHDGLKFDYRLLPGAATTRNAILLLRQRGAPEGLVAHALARAAELDQARRGIVH